MPPLPNTIPSLTQRLTTLSEQNKTIIQLIQRLARLDFQPGSLPLGSNDGDPRLELSAEIHESLKGIEEELELLRQEVEDVVQQGPTGIAGRRRDSVREQEKSRLAILLARLTEDLRSSRTQFRKAQLTAKRSADLAKQRERALLFSNLRSSTSTPTSFRASKATQASQLTADEVIANASSDVTAALRRTHQLMQSELSRSRFAQQTLENSTKALEELGEKYTDLGSLLQNSRNLVGTLLKSQKSDTWYLETAFYILCTTIIWLIFRRWLYGPLTWFIWSPLILLYKLTFGIFAASGLSGKAQGTSVSVSQSTSTSLIVKPSATGGIPKRPLGKTDQLPYIKVGGGGRGWGHDPSPPGSVSRQVGQMAEKQQSQSQQQGEQRSKDVREQAQTQSQAPAQQNADAGSAEGQDSSEGHPVRRGDGTILQERGDRPSNPKKRMWEEGVEREKFERAEREEVQQQQEGTRRKLEKRDEL
ncbi:Sec20-domain-containing protein [Delitschia confertaspora ATCC 74209]|uniref:Sec20-domain-containing protein n=1 Tax=Delitschia confertaspora ATCC 74209 TaxID=1513339 RepID=A0A9P4MVA3_9PLEO|nr:Sec20-domain-containing protein [Delitschia confertaspora ATCC 74209]